MCYKQFLEMIVPTILPNAITFYCWWKKSKWLIVNADARTCASFARGKFTNAAHSRQRNQLHVQNAIPVQSNHTSITFNLELMNPLLSGTNRHCVGSLTLVFAFVVVVLTNMTIFLLDFAKL